MRIGMTELVAQTHRSPRGYGCVLPLTLPLHWLRRHGRYDLAGAAVALSFLFPFDLDCCLS